LLISYAAICYYPVNYQEVVRYYTINQRAPHYPEMPL
jgi:hypothetical protein